MIKEDRNTKINLNSFHIHFSWLDLRRRVEKLSRSLMRGGGGGCLWERDSKEFIFCVRLSF